MIYDLAIVGGGPAGYTAAIEAEREGLKVILFEKDKMGGVCLNKGCIPMKSFLHCSDIYHWSGYWNFSDSSFELKSAIEFGESNIKRLGDNLDYAMKKESIEVKLEMVNSIKKKGAFQLETDISVYSAKNLIIAVGSQEIVPNIDGLQCALKNDFAIMSQEIFKRENLPENIVIIGAGFAGIEIASFLRDINKTVTVIDKLENPFHMLDQDIAFFYLQQLRKRGIKFILGVEIKEIDTESRSINYVDHSEDKRIKTDLIVVAAGRKINNIEGENIPGVYICGDANGKSMLAHTAMEEAKAAVGRIVGKDRDIVYDIIPKVIYSSPELAWIGKNQNELGEESERVEVIKVDMNYSSRFVIQSMGSRGIVKILTDRKGESILGCQIVGNGASELISIFSILISNCLGIDQIRKAVFPHPSIAEVMGQVSNIKMTY